MAKPRQGPSTSGADFTLSGISELVFLDRYAMKDPNKDNLRPGDVVVALTRDDPRFPQKEAGRVVAVEGDRVTVEVKGSGERLVLPNKHVDRVLEPTPQLMWDRMAEAIVTVERPERRKELVKEFRWLLDGFRFVPGGRINAMLGTGQQLTAYNCYVIPMRTNDGRAGCDSRAAIIDTLSNMVEIMSRGGGVGINLSTLRPRLSYVKGVNGRSSGSVSWGGLYSFATGLVEQGGCFAGDQRIATTKGLIPAAELAARIEDGEFFEALTHEGPRPITARFRNGQRQVFRVTTRRGLAVDVTAEHRMGVLRDGRVATVPLGELEPGDEVLLLLGTGVATDYVKLAPVVYERSIMSTTLNEDVRFPEVLDERLAYLVGYMHGDGDVHVGKKVNWKAPKAVKLATADAHPEIRERLAELWEEVFGLRPVVENGDGRSAGVTVYSRLLIEWLRQNGLLKARAEAVRVPEAIFRSPSSVMGAFVAGCFDADGSDRSRKDGYGFDCVSVGFVQDVQQLLLANGIVSHISIITDRSEHGWRTIYRLAVTGAEFKARMSQFIAGSAKDRQLPGFRNHFNSYPRDVWPALGVPGKYYRGVWDSTKDRISFRALQRVKDRLADDGKAVLVEAVDKVLNVIPDTIASIEPLGRTEVYDFEVAEAHMLSGNGVYTSNSRRGALMLILNDWHPDVLEFITAKRDMGAITNANISVGISDAFMKAVEQDGDWDLIFPDTSDPDYDRLWDGNIRRWRDELEKPVVKHRTVKARAMWESITESAWASAEPGVVFLDRANAYSNSWYFHELISTNPCGEQYLPAWGVCNLGHLNLARFVKAGEILWDDLRRAARLGVRFLDNIIDYTPYFFEENRRVQFAERRIGMGTLGLGEMLIKLGVRYGSPESLQVIDKVYGFIAEQAYAASADLAAEKGSFARFDAGRFLRSGFMRGMPEHVREAIREKGCRNVTLLTQAPTGSTGTMVGTSTGIEPYYSWTYWRTSRLGTREVRERVVDEWFAAHPDVEPDLENLPGYFVTAMDLTPEEHVRVQAAVQRWTDSSISKTANAPATYTVEQTRKLYEYAYKLGCKGVTIYRDKSRDLQVLSREDDADARSRAGGQRATAAAAGEGRLPVTAEGRLQALRWPRPEVLQGRTRRVATPAGTLWLTINEYDGQPFEVFATIGKAGSDVLALTEAIARLVSLNLRCGVPVAEVVDQLRGIGGSRSVGFGPHRVLSIPDAIGRVLAQDYLGEAGDANGHGGHGPPVAAEPAEASSASPAPAAGSSVQGGSGWQPPAFDMCPVCGNASLLHEEGCVHCTGCGHSEC